MSRIVDKENSEHYLWGENCDGWHLVKSESLSVIEERMPPGCFEKKHYHQKSQQFFFILSGIATFELDNISLEVEKEQGIQIDAGVIHQIKNNQNEDLIFTVTSVPPTIGDRIEV